MGKLIPRSVGVPPTSRSVGVPPTPRSVGVSPTSLPLPPLQSPSPAPTLPPSPRPPIPNSIASLLLPFLLSSSLLAQSAAPSNTITAAPQPQPPQTEKPAAPTPEAAAPEKASIPRSSRYASADLKTYVEALADHLAIRSRATDAFGQLQDPNAKPVIKPTVAKTAVRRILTAEPPSSLSDIVRRIEITTIMPRDKRFLVGSRSIAQGDKVPLNFRNKQIHTEVTEVSARRIVFRNLDTGEIGTRQLNLLPPGMTPGTRNILAPGMVPANPSTPLEIDSPPPSPATVTNS